MTAADAEIGGSDHHADRSLAEIELLDVSRTLVPHDRRDESDRRDGSSNMPSVLPDLGERTEPPAIRHEDEVPRLPVTRRRRPSPGLQDPLQTLLDDRLLVELAHIAARPDCMPGLHAPTSAGNAAPRNQVRAPGNPVPQSHPTQHRRSEGDQMGFDQYHEPPDELPAATRTFARLCASLTEEAEAIGWYEQRLAVETDPEATAIMRDAQGEEFKHFSMDLESLLRRTPRWREIARGVLFQPGDIVEHGEEAEADVNSEGVSSVADDPAGSLAIGSLRGSVR